MTDYPNQRPLFILGLMLALWAYSLGPVYGQSPLAVAVAGNPPPVLPKQSSPGGTDQSAISMKLLEDRLAAARTALAAYTENGGIDDAPPGVSLQDVQLRRALLQRRVFAYEQQLRNTDLLAGIRARRVETGRKAEVWSQFAESPPYSILLTDSLREQIQVEGKKKSSNEAALSKLEQLIDESRLQAAHFEERIRQLNEQLESLMNGEGSTRLVWRRDFVRLRYEVAAAGVAVLDLERRIRLELVAESRMRLGLLQRKLMVAGAKAKFSHGDLIQVTERIEQQRKALREELGQVRVRREAAREALESAQNKMRGIKRQPAAGPNAVKRIAETVSAHEVRWGAVETSLQILRLLLECTDVERTAWEIRYAAYGSQRIASLREAERRLSSSKNRLDLWRDQVQQELEVSSRRIQFQADRLNSLPANAGIRPVIAENLSALRETDHLLLRFMRRIEHLELLVQRWEESLQLALKELPLTDRVQHLFSDAERFFMRVWTFELFTAEDTIRVEGQTISGQRSVTVGKILMAIIILAGGVWITGLISRVMQPIIARRFNIETNQANLIQRWVRAAMIICLVLFSMASVKIPLTVFAFAGGALAIGLGFGMQTLLKNFVSGLILLFERPFRVGDVIDVDGQRGTVTAIGLRASVLELTDGKETMIPNSFLLESNVTNWAYSNRKVRFTVTVGVAYDADLRLVMHSLDNVAERHGLVLKEPKPHVLLTGFGDNALTFELRFWVTDVTQEIVAQISSDLRLMIAAAFAEHGLVIAFPQRDIHIDAKRPLPVAVMPPGGPAVNTGA